MLLTEAHLEGSTGPFDLAFAQMPRVAAYLEVALFGLGFAAVEELLGPAIGPRPTRGGMDVALALHGAFRAWLREQLPPEHADRKSRVIRDFLAAREVADVVDIDDRAILDFWLSQNAPDVEAAVEGFRLFRNAAQEVLLFREALRAALAERAEADGVSMNDEGRPASLEGEMIQRPRNADGDGTATASDPLAMDEWVSPLRTLFAPPCDRVAWLKKEGQRNRIALWLADPEALRPCLFGALPPDPRLYRTLLRFDHFGDWQNRLVEALKTRAGSNSRRVETAPGPGYGAIAAEMGDLQGDVDHVVAAAALALLQAGRLEGLLLAFHRDADAVRAALRDREMGELLRDPLALRGLAAAVRRGERLPETRGLKADRRDEETVEALAEGATALLALARSLDAYVRWLTHQDLRTGQDEDHATFAPRLHAMHERGPGAEARAAPGEGSH